MIMFLIFAFTSASHQSSPLVSDMGDQISYSSSTTLSDGEGVSWYWSDPQDFPSHRSSTPSTCFPSSGTEAPPETISSGLPAGFWPSTMDSLPETRELGHPADSSSHSLPEICESGIPAYIQEKEASLQGSNASSGEQSLQSQNGISEKLLQMYACGFFTIFVPFFLSLIRESLTRNICETKIGSKLKIFSKFDS